MKPAANLAAALEYAALGYPTFALKPKGKAPATKHGKDDATTDPDTLRAMIAAGHNVGILWPAGVLALDLDVPKDEKREPLPGARAYADHHAAEHEARFPELRAAPRARSRADGVVWPVRLPDGVSLPSTVGAVTLDGGGGIDLRGDGRTYTAAPPSIVKPGRYTWERPLVPLADLPVASAALLDYLTTSKPKASANGHADLGDLTVGGAGAAKTVDGDPADYAAGLLAGVRGRLGAVTTGRNVACFGEGLTLGRWVGGYTRAGLPGLDEHTAADTLRDAMKANGDYDADPTKAEGTIRNALREGMTSAYQVTHKPRPAPSSAPLGREPGDEGPTEADAPAEVRARNVADSPPRSARRSPDLAGDPLQGMTRELAEALASFRDSDLGNGERLAYLYGDRMLFVPGIGAHVYDGTRWRLDDAGMVHRYAKRMLRMLYAAAAMLGEGESDRAAALAKHAARSERGRALDLAIERAWRGQEVAELIVRADELDADPDLLNVANGTIHLPTGRLRPHNPRDRITKLCPVVYDPTARAPLWEAFQERITNGDRELIEYKRRAFGYTLTGHTNEQAVFIAHGAGANGKSTELELVADVGGDYAAAASFDTFASTRDGKVQRFGLAGLAGARFVRASEGEAGAKLAEGTVKVVTGGEVMRAEYKGRDAFEFRPRFALWLATNHRPETRGTDHGLWRRIKLVPYTVTIPEAERDRDLPAKLRAELPGILAWLIEGARAWYADGLREPAAVTDATTAYRADMDVLADFLDAYVSRGDPNAYEGSSRLHDAYEAWCRHNREAAVSQKALSGMLAERGFTKRRTRSGIVWDGLKLTEEGEAAADEAATVKGVGR